MRNYSIFRFLPVLVLFAWMPFIGMAQEEGAPEKKTPDLILVNKLVTGGKLQISARLSWYENRKDHPVPMASIDFIIGANDNKPLPISGVLTDDQGFADVVIDSGAVLPMDKEGFISVTAGFAGNDTVEPAESEIRFQKAFISMKLELVDSVKTVIINAGWMDAKGNVNPLANESVTISVQRMLSLLPVGDVSLDENGQGSMEFPGNLPGDSTGRLEVVASIAEHEVYGNIETRLQSDWGLPKVKIVVDHRTLWSHIAPVWMIVTLTIMLIGVWAHYLYVIIQLIRIRNKGKKLLNANN